MKPCEVTICQWEYCSYYITQECEGVVCLNCEKYSYCPEVPKSECKAFISKGGSDETK